MRTKTCILVCMVGVGIVAMSFVESFVSWPQSKYVMGVGLLIIYAAIAAGSDEPV
jgi:hypothetical protein